jgi:ligand-binding SRPBCC domain-containing protein
MYVLTCQIKAPIAIQQAFAVFESPYNLARITPPALGFRITTPGSVVIRQGAEIDYQIRWLGLPISWKTIITQYDPPHSFEDEQAGGPYAFWRHRHGFQSVEDGTIVSDRVEYDLPLGVFGKIAHRLTVGKQLRGIFEYRGKRLVQLLGGDPARYEFSPVVIIEAK